MNNEFLSEGLFVTLVGVIIVFAALLIIYLFFQFLPKLINLLYIKKQSKNSETPVQQKQQIDAEALAAISAAINLYLSSKHDEESQSITIKMISRRYSPWSSKIYAMNNLNKPYF